MLAAMLSGYSSPFADRLVDAEILPPDSRRQLSSRRLSLKPVSRHLKLWPIIDRALTWLVGQQLINPQAVAGVTSQAALQSRLIGQTVTQTMIDKLNRELQESIAAGEGAREWSARMSGVVGVRHAYEETISRTATHKAYHDGQKKVLEGPAGSIFQYRQYQSTRDTRTRESHREMDGKVYHKDSPMARHAAELLGEFNCRCTERPVRRKEAERLGIDDDTGWSEPIQPQTNQEQSDVKSLESGLPFFEDQLAIAKSRTARAEQLGTQSYHKRAGLTDTEYAAIQTYSTSVYGDVNNSLRGTGGTLSKDTTEAVERQINSALAKLPETPGVTYRGFDAVESINSLEPGDVFTDKAFLSTSTDQSSVGQFGRHRMVITHRSGKQISDLVGGLEQETLFPTNAKFRVTDRQKEGGTVTLWLVEI